MRREITVKQCSIIYAAVDAVVNASNPDAVLGGGVSRALFDECGGDVLQREMREKLDADFEGKLGADDCLVTSAGTSTRLRFVLHVASVDYRSMRVSEDGRMQASSAERVASGAEAAMRAAAELAHQHGPLSVAFPLLGSGSGHLAPAASLKAIIDGMRRVFRDEPDAPVTRVVFAVPEPETYELAKRRLDQLLVLR